MIEFKFRAPFYIFQDLTEEGDPIPVTVESEKELSRLCTSLKEDIRFIDDLHAYTSPGEVIAGSIFPMPTAKWVSPEFMYIEICSYTNCPIVSNEDVEKLKEYIKGQVSDGWGENGFDLIDGYYLQFKWELVDYENFRIVSEEEFDEIFLSYHKNIKDLRKKMSESVIADLKEALDLTDLREAVKLLRELKEEV